VPALPINNSAKATTKGAHRVKGSATARSVSLGYMIEFTIQLTPGRGACHLNVPKLGPGDVINFNYPHQNNTTPNPTATNAIVILSTSRNGSASTTVAAKEIIPTPIAARPKSNGG
jgi:hypothetical protein